MLLAGTLTGTDRIAVPPYAWVEEGGKSLVMICYLGKSLSGYPGMVHGGLLAALLDEGLARCCFPALPNKIGVTANLNLDYRAPALTEGYFVLRANTTKVEGRKAFVEGRIESLTTDETTEPTVHVEAKALFVEPRNAAVSSLPACLFLSLPAWTLVADWLAVGIAESHQDDQVACPPTAPYIRLWIPFKLFLSPTALPAANRVQFRLPLGRNTAIKPPMSTQTILGLPFTPNALQPIARSSKMSESRYVLVSLPSSIAPSHNSDDALSAISDLLLSELGADITATSFSRDDQDAAAPLIPFNIPTFKIGTLDALVQQAEELEKLNALCETVIGKVGDVLASILEGKDVDVDAMKLIDESEFIRRHSS